MHTPSEEKLAELGPVQFVIRPPWTNVAAGIIVAILIVGAMIALTGVIGWQVYKVGGRMPWWVEKGMCWGAVVLFALILLALGVALFALIMVTNEAHRKWTHARIYVCEHGFYTVYRHHVTYVLYDEIFQVLESITKTHPPILYPPLCYLLPPFRFYEYTVVKNNRKRIQFNTNSGSREQIRFFAQILENEMRARSVEWTVSEESPVLH